MNYHDGNCSQWEWAASQSGALPPGPPAEPPSHGSRNPFRFGEKRWAPVMPAGVLGGPAVLLHPLPGGASSAPSYPQGAGTELPRTFCDIITSQGSLIALNLKCQAMGHDSRKTEKNKQCLSPSGSSLSSVGADGRGERHFEGQRGYLRIFCSLLLPSEPTVKKETGDRQRGSNHQLD